MFEMNVAEYPASANTYDSLSDAYLADGNTVDALKYAEKALKALESDTQAPDAFKQLVRRGLIVQQTRDRILIPVPERLRALAAPGERPRA